MVFAMFVGNKQIWIPFFPQLIFKKQDETWKNTQTFEIAFKPNYTMSQFNEDYFSSYCQRDCLWQIFGVVGVF